MNNQANRNHRQSRRLAELALRNDLVPLLKKRAGCRDISGLNAYES